VTVILQAADVKNASNGNAAYDTSRLSAAGLWLRLAARTVHLAPHAARTVSFTLAIPKGAIGASHYLGVVAINAADLATAHARKVGKRKTFTFYRINRQAIPITIRLPGPLTRSLSFRGAKLTVAPAGASLKLGLLPGGSELTQGARLTLHVLRGSRTVFTYAASLGQLFPSETLNYNVPWSGRPTPGTYRIVGLIRPKGAPAVTINTTVQFTSSKAAVLRRETPPAVTGARQGLPGWVTIALGIAAALLITLSLTVYKLARRTATPTS
jgi:hypothetical protein